VTGPDSPATDLHSAAVPRTGGFVASDTKVITTLAQRADFLAAARARHRATPGFVVQARQRPAAAPGAAGIRVGFTCSKKVGNAVARNRAKRRLRAIARLVLPVHGRPGWDYVLIGRRDVTASRDFWQLQADLAAALAKLHAAHAP
jgi:ribonuclease P protein component